MLLSELTSLDVTTICNTVLGALTLISGIVGIIFGYLAKKSANRAEDHGVTNAAGISRIEQKTDGMTDALVKVTGEKEFAAGQKNEKEAEAGRKVVEINRGNHP